MKTKSKNDRYTYRVTWSEEDGEHIGLCAEFPSLSWLAKTPEGTLRGVRRLVSQVIADMEDPHADGELREGGYGLHIIRQLLDHVEYQREDGQNILILEKALVPALDHVKS